MQTYGQPRQMNCPACGTTGVQPKLTQSEDSDTIYTEAKYVCPRCGNYFHKAAISQEPKQPSDSN